MGPMAGYKEPGFQDRVAAAAEARAKALARLQAKPPVAPEVLAERAAKARERDIAQAEKRAAALAEREAKKAEQLAKAEEQRLVAEAEALAAMPPPPKPEMTDEERKALRDAKYAARKARKK